MRTYEYREVPPRIWEALLSADSKGIYLNLFIKPVYESHEVAGQLRDPEMA